MSLLQFVNKAGEVLERGDVVVIAPRQPDMQGREEIPAVDVDLAQRIYDVSVCGVVYDLYAEHKPESGYEAEANPKALGAPGKSGRGRAREKVGATQAFTLKELETLDRTKIAPGQMGHLMVGGICVVCKVDADVAPIKPGDLLTTSATKGHAQKVDDSSKAAGALLGKALGSLKTGKGTIPVLVTLP
jgi:hypothetical protein